MYEQFDYLCDEPFYIEGIGTIKSPTLRDIRKITYSKFYMYLKMLSISIYQYIEITGLKDKYEKLTNEEKEANTLFRLFLNGQEEYMALVGLLKFFLVDEFEFDEKMECFLIYKTDEKTTTNKEIIGKINSDNFDIFRNEILKILGCKQIETKKPKFKSEKARLLYEKIQKEKEKLKDVSKGDSNLTLDNMIKKYCTHNKVGINILNVWNMTYFQFITMFDEYCVGRQADNRDNIASNTFSYTDESSYDSQSWLKIINNNNN